MISKAEAIRRLKKSDKVYYVMFHSESVDDVYIKEERAIEEVQTNALISISKHRGQSVVEEREVYFYFKEIERCTESFIEFTTFLGDLTRFYFERAKEEWEVL